MTDFNVEISDAKTGNIVDKFSFHKGELHQKGMLEVIRNAIKFYYDLDHYVNIAQKKQAQWETIAEFIRRIVVPGGWLYEHGGRSTLVFVPFPLNEEVKDIK